VPGDPDPLYVLARRALLDGLDALTPHLDSVVVIGAQAVYVHTGPADLPVAEFTTDADVAIGPEFLAGEPSIQELLEARGFELQEDPGKWKTRDGIQVDLLVPEALAGPGRRGARLPGHGKRAARRAKGIEGVLVDNVQRDIAALDPTDDRSFHVRVAGPASLLIAKIHKIAERVDDPDRVVEKDALDVLRLLQAITTDELATGLERLRGDDRARSVTEEAVVLGDSLFSPGGAGLDLAAESVRGLAEADVTSESLQVLWADLTTALAT
jgi:hypothetical protein